MCGTSQSLAWVLGLVLVNYNLAANCLFSLILPFTVFPLKMSTSASVPLSVDTWLRTKTKGWGEWHVFKGIKQLKRGNLTPFTISWKVTTRPVFHFDPLTLTTFNCYNDSWLCTSVITCNVHISEAEKPTNHIMRFSRNTLFYYQRSANASRVYRR